MSVTLLLKMLPNSYMCYKSSIPIFLPINHSHICDPSASYRYTTSFFSTFTPRKVDGISESNMLIETAAVSDLRRQILENGALLHMSDFLLVGAD